MNLTFQKTLAILHLLQDRKWGEAKGLQNLYTWWIFPKDKCPVKWVPDPAKVTQWGFVFRQFSPASPALLQLTQTFASY